MNELFKNRIKTYQRIQDEKKRGLKHFIPYKQVFPKLSTYVPGIYPYCYTLVSAFSGVGKSKLARFMNIRLPLAYCKMYPESGLKCTVIFNTLEETKEEILDHLIVSTAANNKIEADWLILRGMSEKIVDDDTLTRLNTVDFSMYDNLKIVDIPSTFGLLTYVKSYMNEIGTFYNFKGQAVNKTESMSLSFASYIPDDPFHIVIVINDHIGLFADDKDKNTYQTIQEFSAIDCRRKMSKGMGCSVVNIQQHYATSGKKMYTNTGEPIVDALLPAPDQLGDNKSTHRDVLLHYALFDPSKYNIQEMYGYSIDSPNIKTLHILKNRISGMEGVFIPMLFDGNLETFMETKLNKVF